MPGSRNLIHVHLAKSASIVNVWPDVIVAIGFLMISITLNLIWALSFDTAMFCFASWATMNKSFLTSVAFLTFSYWYFIVCISRHLLQGFSVVAGICWSSVDPLLS